MIKNSKFRKLAFVSGFFWNSIRPVEVSSCIGLVQDAIATKMDAVETYAPKEFEKLLFISDGIDVGWGSTSLGEQVGKKYPALFSN